MYDTVTLITFVYQAYEYVHPEAEHEQLEAWDAALHAAGKPSSDAMEAYARVCSDCLVQVFETGDRRKVSANDLVMIGVAAGYYDAMSQMTKELDKLHKIALTALGNELTTNMVAEA